MVTSLPCSGKLDILYLTKIFETGADGVAIMVCPEGDCRYVEGNKRARKRAEAVDTLLAETGMGKGRVRFIQLDDSGVEKAVRELDDFCREIRALPHNRLEPVVTASGGN
jgi:coenzyme F420-reducing hydrogenase delta subunit